MKRGWTRRAGAPAGASFEANTAALLAALEADAQQLETTHEHVLTKIAECHCVRKA